MSESKDEALMYAPNLDLHVVEGPSSAALVSFSDSRELSVNSPGAVTIGAGSHPIRNWGPQNNLPQLREQIIKANAIVPSLMRSQRNIILGGGLYTYKEEFVKDTDHQRNIIEEKMPDDIAEFFDRNNIDDFLSITCKNLIMHAQYFAEFVMTRDGKQVHTIKAHQARHTRAGLQNEQGVIDYYYLCGQWVQEADKPTTEIDRKIFRLPAYNPEKIAAKFMLHIGDDLLTDDYYCEPYWWGNIDWMQVSNAIPRFHLANLKHGYTIRYHIKVPKGYFYTSPESQSIDALKKAKDLEAERKKAFMKKVNDLLAGYDNAGRTLFTDVQINQQLGKEYPGISIEPISVDLKDKAMLELFEKSNQANISALGIHPTLANIESQGKLSSGSEIRNALLIYQAIHTPHPRKLLLKALNLIKKINDWPKDIHFGFRDIQITKLDDNPAGVQESTMPDPSTKTA